MNVRSEFGDINKVVSDVVAIFFLEDERLFKEQISSLVKPIQAKVQSAVALRDFSGKEGEVLALYTEKAIASPRLLLVGVGKAEKLSLEQLRRASASAAKKAQSMKATSLAIEFPSLPRSSKIEPADAAQALVEGSLLSVYKYDKYLTKKDDETSIGDLALLTSDKTLAKDLQRGASVGQVVSTAVYHARDLENAPSNDIYPESLAKDAQACGKQFGFGVTVFDQRKIESLKMGGVVSVSKGSINPPRFVVLEHNRVQQKKGTVVLVGKGVTFDSGGISIKPSANMAEMKMDMSGAAAVIGTFQAITELKLPVHVIGLIPSVENMPSGTAVKPGDIIRQFNGKTSEVDNTDAEGRLILADALGYASRYKPEVVIDLATLTGACVVALGHLATGMMGNDQPSMDALKVAGEKTYERVWQLPMFDEYEKLIKSDVADVKNTGGRWGGAITAGWFLKKFIGDYKWIHLDIAGTAILEENGDYAPRGGSGVGVRLLVEYLRNFR